MGFSNRKFEREYFDRGRRFIAGLDEVGMGCLAGPVVAAAVILRLEDIPRKIDDSKALTALQRVKLDIEIRKRAVAFAIGSASVEEIDTINILQAARLAMARAVRALAILPDLLLIDGRFRIDHDCEQLTLIKGDHLSVSIGAASIIAKVHRDTLMAEMDSHFPGYGFAKHKGYGSHFHRVCLMEKGPSPIHRKSFSWTPV